MIFKCPPQNPWRAVFGEKEFMAWAVEESGTDVDITNKNCIYIAGGFLTKTFIKFQISFDEEFSDAYKLTEPQMVVRVKNGEIVWSEIKPAYESILYQAKIMTDRKGPMTLHGSQMEAEYILSHMDSVNNEITKGIESASKCNRNKQKILKSKSVKNFTYKFPVVESQTLPLPRKAKPNLTAIDEKIEVSDFVEVKENTKIESVKKESPIKKTFRSRALTLPKNFSMKSNKSSKPTKPIKPATNPFLFCAQTPERSSIVPEYYQATSYRSRSNTENFHLQRRPRIKSPIDIEKRNSSRLEKVLSVSSTKINEIKNKFQGKLPFRRAEK